MASAHGTGRLYIDRLRLSTIIGTYPHERLHAQTLLLSLELIVDAAGACADDELDGTLDYERLSQALMERAADRRYLLIERLAADLLEVVMAEPRVLHARLRLDKPGAVPRADSVGFELTAGDPDALRRG